MGRSGRAGGASYGIDGRDPASLVAAARTALTGNKLEIEASGEMQVTAGARMRALMQLAERAAAARSDNTTVLLLGETGVGKTMLARWIHEHSPRKTGRFERLDLARIPATLIEDALFGHAKGAFSGAFRDQPGPFELAHGGTLQLDEIGELPLPLQVKLLSVLQERVVSRLGETRSRPIDVRVIASTNRDLRVAVARGEFRPDLYFRLNVIPLVLPPLRERRDEIPGLAHAFLARAAADENLRDLPLLSPSALAALESYEWPGNIRELENTLRRAVILCGGHAIEANDLGLPTVVHVDHAPTRDEESVDLSSLMPAQQGKRAEIIALLESKQWVVERAVREYGVCKASFYKLMRELRIPLRRRS